MNHENAEQKIDNTLINEAVIASLKLRSIQERMESLEKDIKSFPLPPAKKGRMIKTTSETYGYRWVADSNHTVYIVKIKILNDYCHDENRSNTIEYFTDRCRIVEITRLLDNKQVSSIEGQAIAHFRNNIKYGIGNLIQGQNTWFCLSIDNLLRCQGQTMKRHLGNNIDIDTDPPTIKYIK